MISKSEDLCRAKNNVLIDHNFILDLALIDRCVICVGGDHVVVVLGHYDRVGEEVSEVYLLGIRWIGMGAGVCVNCEVEERCIGVRSV